MTGTLHFASPHPPPKHIILYLPSLLQILSTMLDCEMLLLTRVEIPRHSRPTNLLSELASHGDISHQDNNLSQGYFISSTPTQIPSLVIQDPKFLWSYNVDSSLRSKRVNRQFLVVDHDWRKVINTMPAEVIKTQQI